MFELFKRSLCPTGRGGCGGGRTVYNIYILLFSRAFVGNTWYSHHD